MMTATRFRPITIADVSDADIESINDSLQVPQLVRPGTPVATVRRQPAEPSRQEDSKSAAAAAPRSEGKLTIRVPVSLNDAMKRDALDQRCHVRTIVLNALYAAGHPVVDEAVPTERQPPVVPSRQQSVTDDAQAGPSPQQKLSIDMPDACRHALKQFALMQGVPVRVVVLTALRDYGYSIAAADLAPGAGGNC